MAQVAVIPGRLRMFLCHAAADKPAVRVLWRRLREAGFEPWLDEENLLPGQVWEMAVVKALRESDVVVVCISGYSVSTAGFRHKEIKFALDVADEQPEGRIFVIPVKIEECDIPVRLKHLHVSDLTHENGFERLVRSLSGRAVAQGYTPIHIDAERSPLILYSTHHGSHMLLVRCTIEFGHEFWPTFGHEIWPTNQTQPDSFVLAGFDRLEGAAGWIGEPKWNYTRRSGVSTSKASERF